MHGLSTCRDEYGSFDSEPRDGSSELEADPGAARTILVLELSPRDRERMDLLAAKARSGNLTPDEEAEVESYRQVATLVELLKSKARLYLKTAGLAP